MKITNYRSVPASVYRLQLSSQFNFKKATQILPYLKELGIEGVYCSPYFKSYSEHGYDITDPNVLNPQLGTLGEYHRFCQELKRLEMFQIVDIVPNHMGTKGGQNHWWQDVLENGPYSEYASYFDVNWRPEKQELQDKVLLPILGQPYGKVLENGEIKLTYAEGNFTLHYADYPLPMAPHTLATILESGLEELKSSFSNKDPKWIEYQALIAFYHFFPLSPKDRAIKKIEGKKRLSALLKASPVLANHLKREIARYNGKGKRWHFDRLDKLIEGQFYRLAYWRVARHEINYRLFFNIPELVSIRMEEERVFEIYHRLLMELVEKGCIQGLRIDHPDGLYNPIQYFERLRKKIPLLTVVEKILSKQERLPENWQIEGSVGYDYLQVSNGLFVKQSSAEAFTEIYEDFIGKTADFETIAYESKKFFAQYNMLSDIEAMGLKIDTLSETNREYRDFTRHELTRALTEVFAFFPVYRTYIGPDGTASKHDCHFIHIAIEKAKNKTKNLDLSIFDFLEKILTLTITEKPEIFELYKNFALHFQQMTGSIMAKGVEDTAFYIYNRFISLNEVGCDPQHFGSSVGEFHRFNEEKRKKWPYGFLATSTHDTKRSEDVRMRLHVLSEMPLRWKAEVKKWAFVNSKYKKPEISANTEYYIYQTLLGVWPATPFKDGNYSNFCERIWQIFLKAVREAKLETNWVFPNTAYEEAVHTFLLSILAKTKKNHFLELFLEFHKLIDHLGGLNSLSHSLLKIASCGVVDLYQGNETLTYRLTDPDNRYPVDYVRYKKMLRDLSQTEIDSLFAHGEWAQLKLCLQKKALNYRVENKELFLDGEYIPLKIKGEKKENVVAFMRRNRKKIVIVLAGRFFSELTHEGMRLPLGKEAWGNTEVILPANLSLTDLFTQKKRRLHKGGEPVLKLSEVFDSLPISYLILKSLNQ